MRSLRDRFRALDPAHVDLLVAVVLAVAGVLGAMLGKHDALLAQVLGIVGITVPVAWRRRAPLAAAVTLSVALTVSSAFGGSPTQATGVVALLAVVCVGFAVGMCARKNALIASTAALVAAFVVQAALDGSGFASALVFFTIFVVGLPIAAGRAARNRARLADELADRTRQLERAREAEAEAAVRDERARIARELHDVVAHDVSVMVVQAAAANRMVDTQPDRAAEAIGSIEGTGREALGEMRRLLGVLRRGDEDLALAPQPSLTRLDALVARTREAGVDVEVERVGEASALPAGVDLAAYRVVQEGLANVVAHAGAAHARVRVSYRRRSVELEVSDDGRGSATNGGGQGHGHGLSGLRERVDLYGGEFAAGPSSGGGFAIRARLPLEGGTA